MHVAVVKRCFLSGVRLLGAREVISVMIFVLYVMYALSQHVWEF